MTVHQCPKCELRFEWKTELDDHCWHDHPEFRHEYPVPPIPELPIERRVVERTPLEHPHIGATSLIGWVKSHEHDAKRGT